MTEVCHAGIFSWIFPSHTESVVDHTYPKSTVDSSLSVKIPFEMKTEDENFISAVAKFTSIELSELDICHHRVILNLKKSCSELTEEDLAKTAVNLLNCQSAVEGRTLFPCSSEMALYECTKNMDQNTWNAYHIVSNRVRAVCYHFRQQQFTAKTEFTVNKLLTTTVEQIEGMKQLEESQGRLKAATSDVFSEMMNGHESLQKQQEELAAANANLQSYVASNVQELYREKRLIASGQKELAQITRAIRMKLGEAQAQLNDQGHEQRETHQKIIQELSEIQENARRVWSQIDESTHKILANHDQTVAHYAQLMKDFQKMNSTVQSLSAMLKAVKVNVEHNFSWISNLLGGTDATVQKIYCFVLHLLYCLVGMVASTFLQVPYGTRMVLITLVPLNAVAEIRTGSSLPIPTMTIVLLACVFLNIGSILAVRLYRWRKHTQKVSLNEQKSHFDVHPQNGLLTANSNRSMGDCGTNEVASEAPKPLIRDSFDFTRLTSSPSKMTSLVEESDERDDDDDHLSTSTNFKIPDSPSVLSESIRRRFADRSSPSRLLSRSLLSPSSPKELLNQSLSWGNRSHVDTPEKEKRNSGTPRKFCASTCRNGLPCRNTISVDSWSPWCHRHVNGESRESTPAL